MKQATEFGRTLDAKTDYAIRLIHELNVEIRKHGPKRVQTQKAAALKQLYKKEGIAVFVFRNDELILWSDNSIPPLTAKRTAALGTEIHHFENGWYRLLYFTDGIDEYIGSILISHTYPYQNEYLSEGFTEDFKQPNLTGIRLNREKGSVKLKADHQSFYLTFESTKSQEIRAAFWFVGISLIGGFLILLSTLFFYRKSRERSPPFIAYPVLVIVIVLLRYLTLQSGWPGFTANLSFFDPTLYASSFVSPTFADFLINIFILAALAYYARNAMKEAEINSGEFRFLIAFSFGAALFFLLGAWVNQLAKGLVINSSIPFEIYNINKLSTASIIGIASIGVLYFTAFMIADGLAHFARRKALDFKSVILSILVLTFLWLLITHYLGIRDLAFLLWPPLLLLFAAYFRLIIRGEGLRLVDGTVLILFFSTIGAYNLYKYTAAREHNQRRILAEKFAINDDPIAEVLFSELVPELVRDNDIKQLFEEEEDLHSRETLENYVLSRYFTGYWSKYNITLHAFSADSSVWGKLPARRPATFSELYNKLVKYSEVDSLEKGLHFLYNSPDRTVYMGVIPLNYSLSKKADGYLILDFNSSLFPQQVGFPNLLIDRDVNVERLDEDYSTARYVDGRLISGRGDYPYPSTPAVFLNQLEEGNNFFALRGMEHLVSRFDDDVVVLSKAIPDPLDNITMVTYLSIIYAVLFGLVISIYRYRSDRSVIRFNLNNKIQILLVILAATIMVLFSLATKYYIENKYRQKNERLISEKMHSILLELENKLGEEEVLNYDMADYLNRILSQFSVVFFTDINLYNPSGDLIGSSQMRMFNEGLTSRKIDPGAFVHLKYLDQMEYIQEESIGKLSYLSAYSPLLNESGELIGYANLPYFARQTELTNEISSFLVSVINLFVLVFVLSLALALFISQWITQPLRNIRESLAAIELGKANRLIGYEGRDEIGRLVDEYNTKVAELEINAEKLSQSERETAWREMAKQVAHEIKNPLTPMKLSVQHLERTLLGGGQTEPETVQRVMKNLVEQIDTLSSIANAFSSFAKMPKAKVERIDLYQTVRGALELFNGFERIDFVLQNSLRSSEAPILADRDQLIRVFNNLLKNAVQSIPEERRGKIKINLWERDQAFFVTIKDNGAGISEEQKSKIFVPNFTTKTRGMGLGLAISKKIIENFGGTISFESEIGKGSTFTVKLPKP